MMPSIRPLGDSAALVRWTGIDDDEICRSVKRVASALSCSATPFSAGSLTSVVPAFQSVTVHYCPDQLSFSDVVSAIEEVLRCADNSPRTMPRSVEIPVCFDSVFAPDLAEVANAHHLNSEELIRHICGAEYLVRMIGFSPGFPYLSGLPAELATPRRASPRLKVPKGSVAIGGRQAGIYSLETPGGWNIVGRTPLQLFRPEHLQPSVLTAGDQVRFFPIDADQFHEWRDKQ